MSSGVGVSCYSYAKHWLDHMWSIIHNSGRHAKRKSVIGLERVQNYSLRCYQAYVIMRGRIGWDVVLEHRRLRDDLIEVYKIVSGIDRVKGHTFCPRSGTIYTVKV